MHDAGMALGRTAGIPLTDDRPGPGGACRLRLHRDAHVWAWAAAVAIVGDLRRELQGAGRVRLLVSGHTVAAPVYEALSRAPLDWARVDIGLTDDAWLLPEDPDSRASAVARHLLRDHAANARFEALTRAGRGFEESLAAANAHARTAPALALLTLDDDGCLAGLDPRAVGFGPAMCTSQAYAALGAPMAPGRRIGITPAGLAAVRGHVLLLRGARQREAFEAASGLDARESPVARLCDGAVPLHVHWCP